MWFEADDCSRVAHNSVSFAFNSVLAPRLDADNVIEKSPCLQFEAIISAVRYTYPEPDKSRSSPIAHTRCGIDQRRDVVYLQRFAIGTRAGSLAFKDHIHPPSRGLQTDRFPRLAVQSSDMIH